MTIKEGASGESDRKKKGKEGLTDTNEVAQASAKPEPSETGGESLPEEMKVDALYLAAMELFADTVREHLEDSLPKIAKMWNAIHIFLGDANVAFDSVLLDKYDGLATIPMIERELNTAMMDRDEDEYGETQDRVTPALLLILNGKSEIILYSRVAEQEICILNETDIADEALWENSEALKSALAQIVAVQFSEYVQYAKRYEELTADDLSPDIIQFLESTIDPEPPKIKRRVKFKNKK